MILFSFSTNGQNGAQKNRGLLNKVAETNQLDFVKTKNVLPGASLINCGNHFSSAFFSYQMRLYRRCAVCTLFAFERLSTLSGGPVDVWTSHIKSHTIVVLSLHVSALSDGPVDVWTAKMKLEIHSYGY